MDYNFLYNELSKTNIQDLTTEQIADMKEFIESVTSQSANTYNDILSRQLSDVSDEFDKRQGSIIYDALAPCSGELANKYIETQIYIDKTYLMTARGEDLDRKGEEYGVPRNKETKAQRIAQFVDNNDAMVNVPIGTRFSVPESNNTITYAVKSYKQIGVAIIECEQYGTIGNEYLGDILPLSSVELKSATIIGTEVPAQNDEEDEVYRERIIAHLNSKSFGGNVQDYIEYITEKITGTSKPHIYPVWNGGGTVKISVLDSQYNPITNEFKAEIKEIIDPTDKQGQGLGIAPIGHTVTIDTPTEVTVNITADVSLDGVTVGQVESAVQESLSIYFLNVRKMWADYNTIGIYISQVISRIIAVDGVLNVTNVELNGDDEDIELTSTASTQYVPVLGTITLTEV